MKKMLALTIITALLYACSGGAGSSNSSSSESAEPGSDSKSVSDYDPKRGEGLQFNLCEDGRCERIQVGMSQLERNDTAQRKVGDAAYTSQPVSNHLG